MLRFMGSDSIAGNLNVKIQRACVAHVCAHMCTCACICMCYMISSFNPHDSHLGYKLSFCPFNKK